MWISRQVWEAQQQLLELERQKVVYLERALATSQANADGFRTMFNMASNDRAAIAAMRFPAALPAPQLEGRLQTPTDVTSRAAKETGPKIVGTPDDGMVRTIAEEDDIDQALKNYSGMAGGFEDVGDPLAERMGIEHSPEDGTVVYTK